MRKVVDIDMKIIGVSNNVVTEDNKNDNQIQLKKTKMVQAKRVLGEVDWEYYDK